MWWVVCACASLPPCPPVPLLPDCIKILHRLRASPQDTIFEYDSSLWRMQLCHKSTIPACYSLVNVPIGPEDSND